MKIAIANTDEEIAACFPVMQELRPHIGAEQFLPRVRAQEQDGYQLAYVENVGEVVAVAGFRLGNNFAWGKFLYVDDLVTRADERSSGHGAALLEWLKTYARQAGCQQIHLDSGLQRERAHAFYKRNAMPISGYHFAASLISD